MAFMTSNSRINPANNGTGMKLTPTPGKPQGTKSPSRSSYPAFALDLKHVIGTTATSANGFDCLQASKVFALCAGSAVILTALGENDQVSQRFFRARPVATAASSFSHSISPTTPTRGPDHQGRTIGSVKDAGFGAFCSGTPYGDLVDSPGPKTWTARERIKTATCVSLSPDRKFLAVGEVGDNGRSSLSIRHTNCNRQATVHAS